ncbi:hypothetical protein SAMN05421505_12819 [Sinosporangium album]|uniref:Uncharacterized protein n=1 Tax=Sinosporangium album TaxID=504805 RepID=A0A1G8GN51_9ACTN|nr:hypothetical protein SAMN05421505_12819 [Sinosporangium album]
MGGGAQGPLARALAAALRSPADPGWKLERGPGGGKAVLPVTTTMHTAPDQSPFDTRLQLSQPERPASSPHAAAELADNYTGLPIA